MRKQVLSTSCRRVALLPVAAAIIWLSGGRALGGDITQVCCIGNSITMGAKLEQSQSYPSKLGNLLGSEYDVFNGGMGGACVARGMERTYLDSDEMQDVLGLEPHTVTIMLGTNDSQPLNWANKDSFADNYMALVDSLRSLPSDPDVWLCLPPPAFSHEHDIEHDTIVEQIIPMIRQISETESLPLIDTHTPFSDRDDLYDSDGIHLNDAGTTLMAQVLHDALAAETGSNSTVNTGIRSESRAQTRIVSLFLLHRSRCAPFRRRTCTLSGRALRWRGEAGQPDGPAQSLVVVR